MFPFPRKSSRSALSKSHQDPTALHYGGSLLSERGYDSDAQYLTTPRRDLLGRYPASRGSRRMPLSDLIEQSQERSDAERWALFNDLTVNESQESAFGMHFIPTPPGTLRGPPTTFHTARDINESKYQPMAPSTLRAGRSQGSPIMNMNFGRSLPSLSSTHEPGAAHFEHSPVLNVFENSSGRDIMSDWKQFMKTSRDRCRLGSSGSLPTPSENLVVSKTGQPSISARSFTDPHSIHLGELGISNRLVTHSQTSQAITCDPSITELVHKHKGVLGDFSQENIPSSRSGASASSRNETPRNPNGQRDTSSCYSQASPSSGTLSIGKLSFKKLTGKTLNPKPAMQEILISDSETVNIPAPRSTLLSRFQEHCDSSNLDSPHFQNHATGLVSPRKVSVGWMSGGRRVGYGYSPVPGKGGGSPKKDIQSPLQLTEVSSLKAEFAAANGAYESHGLEQMAQSAPRDYITSSPSHLRTPLYDLADPEPIKSLEPNEYAAAPQVRAYLNRSSQEQLQITSNEDKPRVLCAPELTPTVQTEYCQVPRSSHYTSKGESSEKISRQLARLSRSVSTRFRKQNQKTGLYCMAHERREYNPSDETEPEFLDTDHGESEDQAHQLQPNISRTARWANRISRYRESKRLSIVRQQEHSQSSSGAYEDCDSARVSLKRALSTRSNTTDDADHLGIPGSFEGSRWASRISRLK
ncbi:hypothetical protein N7520_006841 [Penicillium odoratum]|uniref:uncharacterized protein n=1 Tax=Penicillium odoratum TaxID=1167516 RepID=UPI0025466C51|nr:uncharacterized protein N7520_006841 [Penicillium odoratum]KAJ5759685.1 hypothetical protein N7520_006841 [Penicillium odoratum]